MAEQLSYAVKSFKSQKHINITTVMVEVEKAFNNATTPEDAAWLIQWVINNKLVCHLYFIIFFFTILIF